LNRCALQLSILAICLLTAAAGCAPWSWSHAPPPEAAIAAAPIENPLFTPIADHEFIFHQLVDTLDNYFEIDAEERVRVEEGVILEGRIETLPTIGATYLEPWRRDSVGGFERLHATLQTIRRRASARVIPTAQGYLIDVVVTKELEDLVRPEGARVVDVSAIHNTDLERDEPDEVFPEGVLGWIPLGRDAALEQRILGELYNRLDLSGL
jgi:hypothetical protein